MTVPACSIVERLDVIGDIPGGEIPVFVAAIHSFQAQLIAAQGEAATAYSAWASSLAVR